MATPATPNANVFPFLSGGGQMGELIRRYDWSKTSLGPAQNWPLSLRTLLQMMLTARFPMLIFWGSELLTFYNDAFRPSLGGKHPSCLGQPSEQSWAESWPIIGPKIQSILAGADAVWLEDQKVPLDREGQLSYAYWTYSFSPLTDDSGAVNGVLVTGTQTRQPVEKQPSRLSEARFSRLIEQAPVAVALFSGPTFTITLANERVLEYWGRTREQVIDKPLFEALPEAAGQGFEELLKGVYTTGERFVAKELTVSLERKGRLEPTYIDFVYEPFYESDGQLTGVMVICTEITEQVVSRQAVEASEQQLRELISHSPVAVGVLTSRELIIERANDSLLAIWGKDRSVIGKLLTQILPEEALEPFLPILQEVYTTGRAYHAASAQADLVVDGVLRTYYLAYSYTPLRNAAQSVYAILVTAMDVTESVKARQAIEATQQELLQANQRLNLAMNAGRLGSYTLDLATGHMDVSAQCRANYGQPAHTPFNFPDLLETIVADDRQRVQQAVSRAVETRTVYRAEYRIIWPDGTLHWVQAFGQPEYDADGKPVRITGVTQEITAQRMMQEELERQVQQRTAELHTLVSDLRRSNENLEQFAYIASHDLQEPLRKIQQFGDLLQGQYREALGEGTTYLNRMQVAASRMSILIKDLLTFSRIASSQVMPQPVSLGEVIQQVVESLSVAIEESGAQLEVDDLPTLQGDAQQLQQLFQNLLANALKFRRTNSEGQLLIPQIAIRTRQVAQEDLPTSVKPLRDAHTYHLIEVVDNGIGFEQKYVDRIFQVFQRLHGRNEFAGTGVGLAIVQKVVANHGGAITAQSQPGQGATFRVYLPV